MVVENAHPAILTAEEALPIAGARRRQTRPTHFLPGGRSRRSPYLLSGGVFKCGRCGANMVGQKGTGGTYYVCGSQPYRRGMGCGRGTYVPVDWIESEAIWGLRALVSDCADPKGFARRVNEEIAKLGGEQPRQDKEVEKQIAAFDAKIACVRQAIEQGLEDVAWANARLTELRAEREPLVQVQNQLGVQVQDRDARATKASVEEAMRLRGEVELLFEHGDLEDKKRLLRIWVQEMKLAPERREVELTCRVLGPIMIKLVAGAGFEPATFGL